MSIIIKRKIESSENLPADYEKCSKEEALNHQLKVIRDWKPSSDVWPFRYSSFIHSFAASISGGVISSIVRRRLKLAHYGRLAMLLPAMGVPGVFTPILHQDLVTGPLLLQSECPVCLQVRSMVIQNCLALGYPIVIASATGLFLAEKYATYRLPEFSFRVLPEFIKIAGNALMRRQKYMMGLVVFNTLLAGFLTDRQANSYFHIARQQLEIHDEH